MISRFKPQIWAVAVGDDHPVMKGLLFSYGEESVHVAVELPCGRVIFKPADASHH
jgi:hypothetical protein